MAKEKESKSGKGFMGTPNLRGRPPGVPNKVNLDAKKAIAAFIEGNSHRLERWLDLVANGQPEHEIKPNPAKAFELFQSVIEYHVPKLNRTEVQHSVQSSPTEITDADLVKIALQKTTLSAQDVVFTQQNEEIGESVKIARE